MSNNNITRIVTLQELHDQRSIQEDALGTPDFLDHSVINNPSHIVPVVPPVPVTEKIKIPLVARVARNIRCAAKDLRLLAFALIQFCAEKILMANFGKIPVYPDTKSTFKSTYYL
jgi:hypothetical protein